MISILALAVLVLTVSSAQAAVLAPLDAEPQADRSHVAPASCPYQFGSDMPSATFCVYRGVAFGRGGEVCATDIVVIWSSVGSQSGVNVEHEVYLGFVTDPGLVLRAVVDSRHRHRAEMVEYRLARNETPQPLAGETTLRTVRLGSSGAADVLSMKLWESRQFRAGGCALASYSGTFVGVIGPPIETGAYRP
jgi:hypothetical protein